MQDYNYVWGQCFEITLELSCCKYPPADQLEKFWRDNKVALIEYIKQVHLGGYVNGGGVKTEASLGGTPQQLSVSQLTGKRSGVNLGASEQEVLQGQGMGKAGELTSVSGEGPWVLLQVCKGLKMFWGGSKGQALGDV